MNDYHSDLAGAIYNLNCSKPHYGKVKFIVEHFGIKRSTLYRKASEFKNRICCGPGRPFGKSKNVNELEDENEKLRKENQYLENALREKYVKDKQNIHRLTFLLISLGFSGRIIAYILFSVFGIEISHSSILKEAQKYAVKATQIMKSFFHQHGEVVAIDEVFIVGKAVFIAIDPLSMMICNIKIYDNITKENWTEFLNMMTNLKGTISDRGLGILAALTERADLYHQSDIFHCMHTVMKELLKLEKQCYALIEQESKAQKKLNKCKNSKKDARSSAAKLRIARNNCQKLILIYDSLAQAVDMAFCSMTLSDGYTLNEKDEARKILDFVCEWIHHIHPTWKKVISAFQDQYLLEYIEETCAVIKKIEVKCKSFVDKEYVLAVLTYYWEKQAQRRWRGKEVIIPDVVKKDLQNTCQNLNQVQNELFKTLEGVIKTSSSVECVNSRFGFFRYSKKSFSDDFSNLISVVHNMTPFLDGKRKGKSPVQIAGISLPHTNLFDMFDVN